MWGKKANNKEQKPNILKAYETLAEKYNALIDHKPHNAYYDRPNTLRLMGNVRGKKILDAACGPGKYAEELLLQGAEVTGFDISPKMVQLAQKRNPNAGHFFVHDLSQPLVEIDNEVFDMVLSALALHYVEDWVPVVKEFHRVLKEGGTVVISIEHPFFEYTYFNAKNYFSKEAVSAVWRGFGGRVRVPSFRRSLMDCLKPFTDHGFHITELVEPLPVPEFEKRDPKHYKELQTFPAFMCFKAQKIAINP